MKSKFEYTRGNCITCKDCGHSVSASGWNPEQVSIVREHLDKTHICSAKNIQPKVRVLDSAPLLDRARYVLGVN